MCYTEEQIERYLEILDNYSANQAVGDGIEKLDVGIVTVIVFLLNQVKTFTRSVEGVMAMLWGIMIRKSMVDFIFERRVYIRESIIMRKTLLKFLKEYT